MKTLTAGDAARPVLSGLTDGVQAERRGDYLILVDHNTNEDEVRKA